VKELQTICDELLDSSDAQDDVHEKVHVLREAIDLFEQVQAGPETNQDSYLQFLQEMNQEGNLDAIIARLKAITPEEFKEHQKEEFATSVANSLSELIKALQTRKVIDRDEHELVRIALYRSNFPEDGTVEERHREASQLAEDRWLANFPPERQEEWRRASREHTNAIVKTLDDPDAAVPEMPEHLQDIDDPYAEERQAEQTRQQKRFEDEQRQHEELQRVLQQLIDQLKMEPEASKLVEEELRKVRQRLEVNKGKWQE
jgi:hypothetical protein